MNNIRFRIFLAYNEQTYIFEHFVSKVVFSQNFTNKNLKRFSEPEQQIPTKKMNFAHPRQCIPAKCLKNSFAELQAKTLSLRQSQLDNGKIWLNISLCSSVSL